MLLPPLDDDPRFAAAVAAFNEGEFFEAGDIFEELFFEAVRDEVPFVRMMLQASVGCLHAERRQWRAAAERLEEAVRVIGHCSNRRGFDLERFRAALEVLVSEVRHEQCLSWPRL